MPGIRQVTKLIVDVLRKHVLEELFGADIESKVADGYPQISTWSNVQHENCYPSDFNLIFE